MDIHIQLNVSTTNFFFLGFGSSLDWNYTNQGQKLQYIIKNLNHVLELWPDSCKGKFQSPIPLSKNHLGDSDILNITRSEAYYKDYTGNLTNTFYTSNLLS